MRTRGRSEIVRSASTSPRAELVSFIGGKTDCPQEGWARAATHYVLLAIPCSRTRKTTATVPDDSLEHFAASAAARQAVLQSGFTAAQARWVLPAYGCPRCRSKPWTHLASQQARGSRLPQSPPLPIWPPLASDAANEPARERPLGQHLAVAVAPRDGHAHAAQIV